MFFSTSGQLSSYDGTNTAILSAAGAVPTIPHIKGAVAWGGTALRGTISGAPVMSGAFDGNMSLAAAFSIGCDGSAPNGNIYGNVKRVRIFDKALTDAELQEITTL